MDNKHFEIQELANKCATCTCCTGMMGDDWHNQHCRDCRYMEMDNNFWNDGTRRCSWKGEWLSPSSPACYKFTW